MTPEEIRREEIRIASLPGMQEKFREAMGDWMWGDRYYDPDDGTDNNLVLPGQAIEFYEKADWTLPMIRLPHPIDREHPERGLWGMVDWDKWEGEITISGNLCLTNEDTEIDDICDTPYLALLLALAHQWKVEVTK
jgi:hypothetical protein